MVSRSAGPLWEQVKEILLKRIIAGELAPDARIVEVQVARELGVSQAPVREALKSLEALGLVDILPFSGARVHRQTPKELLDAYSVRAELEVLAIRFASARGANFSSLTARMGDMYHAAAEGDMMRLSIADTAFHEEIIKASDNAELLRLWHNLQPSTRAYITLISPGADPNWTVGLHPPILNTLLAGDLEGATEAMRQHFALARARLEVGIAHRGEDEPPAALQAAVEAEATAKAAAEASSAVIA
ncbi:GntR family transcriptional regulator [Isoptericola sp. b441]|uniref:GntR family transcriptional regulator n=1 Tax=Actinotalea lenta TaxID=3064654 RepID=A0ABT9DFA0_9CELL|nr:GntR family transcriptional regulator [Isoptericola sp. b441]MDO8108372.1 GntR family transcriptional regulator [Isoptericola sp. b441]